MTRAIAAFGLTLMAAGLAACAGTHEVTARTQSGAVTTTIASASRHLTKLVLGDTPGGATELRHTRTTLPNGDMSYVIWYGKQSYGPTITTNLTVGANAGEWMSTADAHAAAVGANSGAPNGASIPTPVHTTVDGATAIVYTDASGWTSESWSPRADLLLAVTAYHASFNEIEALARQAEVR